MTKLQDQAALLLNDCEKKGIKQTQEWCEAFIKSQALSSAVTCVSTLNQKAWDDKDYQEADRTQRIIEILYEMQGESEKGLTSNESDPFSVMDFDLSNEN